MIEMWWIIVLSVGTIGGFLMGGIAMKKDFVRETLRRLERVKGRYIDEYQFERAAGVAAAMNVLRFGVVLDRLKVARMLADSAGEEDAE